MRKAVSFENRDRIIQLGFAIANLRKLDGLSQMEFAAKANITRTLLSEIEAPNIIRAFTIDTLFKIADALDMKASDLLEYAITLDNLKNKAEGK